MNNSIIANALFDRSATHMSRNIHICISPIEQNEIQHFHCFLCLEFFNNSKKRNVAIGRNVLELIIKAQIVLSTLS